MSSLIYVFDPTVSDSLSRVRGIGRYLQILRENFEKEFIFTNDLPKIQKSNNPTIFINPFFNILQPPLVMKRVAKKQVAIIHDLIPLKYPQHFPIGIKGKLNVFLNQLALRNYDIIITDSEASKKDIINILRLPENIIHVVYPCLPKIFTKSTEIARNITDTTNISVQSVSQSAESVSFCLYVGDATWNKNLVNLVRALKIINITCIFVGKVFENTNPDILIHPWQQEYREFLHEIKENKCFVLKGFVTDEELIRLYQQSSVNILPSRDEGFGFSYLEASSQRCPSILADIPVLHEISDENAVFANPQDPHDLANKIGEIYFHDLKRKQIGKLAYERNLFFSSSHFKESFLNVLNNL